MTLMLMVRPQQHPYQISMANEAAMREEVEYLLQESLAKPNVTPWSSPYILVPKADSILYTGIDSVQISVK